MPDFRKQTKYSFDAQNKIKTSNFNTIIFNLQIVHTYVRR